METVDTMDLAEYLVDTTDGMEREWDILGDQGAVQTPPLIENMELVKGTHGPLHKECSGTYPAGVTEGQLELALEDGRIDNLGQQGGLVTEWNHGEVELRKRKPPDG